MTVTKPAEKSVTDYLASLVWDGTPRISRWLIDYAGAEDSVRVRNAARAMLVAAVRRARYPGCRLDQMVVLEGPQGCGKTSALRVLAVEDTWFTDEFPLDAIKGPWIVAMSELQGMGRSDIQALKVLLTRQQDEYRAPYARRVSLVPRQFVIVGTVNEADAYLRDPIQNRRFWLVRVRHFNLEKLRADRDQLWAEAAAVEARGEPIRLADVTEGEAVEDDGPPGEAAVPHKPWGARLLALVARIRHGLQVRSTEPCRYSSVSALEDLADHRRAEPANDALVASLRQVRERSL